MSKEQPPLKGLAFGLTFATEFSVVLFTMGYFGNKLDIKYETSGIFFGLGILVGLLFGGFRLYIIIQQLNGKNGDKKD